MLKKVSYKDQIYQYLKEAIVKGELLPGEVYSEKQFADKLNVSRTPVREAVLQLKLLCRLCFRYAAGMACGHAERTGGRVGGRRRSPWLQRKSRLHCCTGL